MKIFRYKLIKLDEYIRLQKIDHNIQKAAKDAKYFASINKIEIGEYLKVKDFTSWAEEDFRKFEGKVILEND